MLSLTRSFALRFPLVAFKSAPIITRSSFVCSLLTYRALSTTTSLFAAAPAKAKSVVSKTAGRSKAKPKTKVKAISKTKAKAKPKVKAKAKAKRKVAAKLKSKPSTRVPLILRPPKRPPTPFLLFYNRTFPSPGSRPGGITSTSKEAGTAWRRLTESEKQPFNDEAKGLMVNYIAQRDNWYKNPKNLQVLRTLNKDRKKRGKKRIHAPQTDSPRRPLPAFMRFTKELRDTNRVSADNAPEGTHMSRLVWAARESGARWQALSASEKEKYTKAYLTDYAKWKAANANTRI